jgi:hypothetical protein
MLRLKKINFKSSNFNYYFKIILFYRNDNDYCRINNIQKVIPKESYKWLKKNHKNRIFFIIKYKKRNIGIINFDKLENTFSIVINKNYRNLGLGGLGLKLLFDYLKNKKINDIYIFGLKKNSNAYNLYSKFSYKKKLLKNGFTKFYVNLKKDKY